MPRPRSVFGHRLYTLRRLAGYSQEKLGKLVGVEQSTVSDWENAAQGQLKPGPTVQQLDVLCEFFGVTPQSIMGRTAFEYGRFDPARQQMPKPERRKRSVAGA